jgi:hypothetical protein
MSSHCIRLGGDTRPADAASEQVAGLCRGQHAEGQWPGALGCSQSGELSTAGHHHGAPGGAGQERANLVGIAGVVNNHQHATPGQQASVKRRLRG